MKLIFVIKSIHTAAGTERATITVINELSKRSHDVQLVSFEKAGEPFFKIDPKVKITYLYPEKDKRPSLVRDFSRRVMLRKIYKQQNPDIVIIVASGRSLVNIPAARGFKKITWEHFNANVNWHLFHPLSKKIAARYSDCIVTLTQQDVENYRKKYSAKNVVCIHNPLTIDYSEKSALTEKSVLTIGRIANQKGYDYLIEAWNIVENRNNGWKLRIIGQGKLLPQLLEQIKHYGLEESIELIPASDNIVEQYKQASIYVMSSRYEGLPLVLIEAMAMGLPIVSFDCETGPREIVIDNVTGKLIPVFDVNKLAIELDVLMSNDSLRKSYSMNAIKKIGKFEINQVVDQWEQLFKNISEK